MSVEPKRNVDDYTICNLCQEYVELIDVDERNLCGPCQEWAGHVCDSCGRDKTTSTAIRVHEIGPLVRAAREINLCERCVNLKIIGRSPRHYTSRDQEAFPSAAYLIDLTHSKFTYSGQQTLLSHASTERMLKKKGLVSRSGKEVHMTDLCASLIKNLE